MWRNLCACGYDDVDVLLQIADDEDELKQIGVAVVKQQATRMVRRRAISYEVVCEIERCTKEMARRKCRHLLAPSP